MLFFIVISIFTQKGETRINVSYNSWNPKESQVYKNLRCFYFLKGTFSGLDEVTDLSLVS